MAKVTELSPRGSLLSLTAISSGSFLHSVPCTEEEVEAENINSCKITQPAGLGLILTQAIPL